MNLARLLYMTYLKYYADFMRKIWIMKAQFAKYYKTSSCEYTKWISSGSSSDTVRTTISIMRFDTYIWQ